MPAATASIPTILRRLRQKYPDARYELDWKTPLELLVATILAAQCTDERVNRVTPALFARYPDARAYAEADPAELEELVRPTGYYRNKAKAIQGACGALVQRFGGAGAAHHGRARHAPRRRPQDGQRGAQHRLRRALGHHRRHPRRARVAAPGAQPPARSRTRSRPT